MKRIISLIVVLMLAGSSAAAETRLQFQGSFTGLEKEDIEITYLYSGTHRYIVSNLLPDDVLDAGNGGILFNELLHESCSLLRPAGISSHADILRSLFAAWVTDEGVPVRRGLYTGYLFDTASEMKCAEITRDSYDRFLESIIKDSTENDQTIQELSASLFRTELADRILSALAASGIRIRLESYDNGKYAVLEASRDAGTILTVSADLSSSDSIRLLVIFTDQGRYCCQDVLLSLPAESAVIQSSFYLLKDPVRDEMKKNRPLYIERLMLSEKQDQLPDFLYSLSSDALESPLVITGYADLTDTSSVKICAKASVEHYEENAFEFTLTLEEKPQIELPDYAVFTERKESTNLSEYVALAAGKLLLLSAAILPNLPASYQNVVNTILFLP